MWEPIQNFYMGCHVEDSHTGSDSDSEAKLAKWNRHDWKTDFNSVYKRHSNNYASIVVSKMRFFWC